MAPIERITLFKIPNDADADRLLEQYKVLAKTATKVCLPGFQSINYNVYQLGSRYGSVRVIGCTHCRFCRLRCPTLQEHGTFV